MKKQVFLLIVFVSCFLSSCRVQRQETQKVVTENNVTTEKVVTFKDTTLFAPKSVTSLKIPISEFVFKSNLNGTSKPKVFTQKNGNATVKTTIVHDTITVTATCDSLAIVAKIKSEFQKQASNSKSNDSTKIDQKMGFSFGNIILAFLLGFGICFILKTFKII